MAPAIGAEAAVDLPPWHPEKVSLAYSVNSRWRNRAEFAVGRPAIVAFLQCKWVRELDYRLIKELWAFTEDRIGFGQLP